MAREVQCIKSSYNISCIPLPALGYNITNTISLKSLNFCVY